MEAFFVSVDSCGMVLLRSDLNWNRTSRLKSGFPCNRVIQTTVEWTVRSNSALERKWISVWGVLFNSGCQRSRLWKLDPCVRISFLRRMESEMSFRIHTAMSLDYASLQLDQSRSNFGLSIAVMYVDRYGWMYRYTWFITAKKNVLGNIRYLLSCGNLYSCQSIWWS